MFRKKVCYYGE